MPNPHQRRLIRTLRRLHVAGEPLNITAVKRRHPELLKAVMAVTPYWGWKRALEDAGIAYSRIKVELLDGIECALCGKWYRSLSGHLPRHEVQADEYRMDYPESDLVCEELRARQTKKESAMIPRWEPLWSREYTLDRLAEYHRRGIPIHLGSLQVNDTSLKSAIYRLAGNWREAVKAIGLDPAKLIWQAFPERHRYPDKAAVLAALRQRERDGRPLNHAGAAKGKSSDYALYNAVKRHFGSWDNALRAAGFIPSQIHAEVWRKLRRYPDKTAVLAAIQQLQREGRSLNSRAVSKGEFSDQGLIKEAYRHFGSWDKALRAAGINPVKVRAEMYRQHRRYPDQAAALAAIQKRRLDGQPLNLSAVDRGRFGDRALYNAAKHHFGSWDNALRAAGIDPDTVKPEPQRKYKTAEDVLKAIRAREGQSLPINASAVRRGLHVDEPLIIWAIRHFGSWDDALRAARINPVKVRAEMYRQHRRYPDPAATLAAIQKRRLDGRPLNLSAVARGKFRDYALRVEAKRHFGSWDKALRAAGFEPASVRLRKSKHPC